MGKGTKGAKQRGRGTNVQLRNMGVAATERWWYGFILRCAQQSTIANNDKCELGVAVVSCHLRQEEAFWRD